MALFRSPLVTLLLILSCCNFASIANSAQSPHAQSPSVVFAFGDSVTDTGNGIRMFNQQTMSGAFEPFGRTYFGKAAGRYSDGRVLIDCIVESLGLSFLNPFFDFVGTDFSSGANYAVRGSSALNYTALLELGYAALTPYTLVDQLQWHLSFLQFAEAGLYGVAQFPTMAAIRQGLYFILIGGEDLSQLFVSGLSTESVKNATHLVVAQVNEAIQLLYEHGARNFLLASPFPMGCLPFAKASSSKSDFDDRGCVPTLNDIIRNYSSLVAAMSDSLSETLPNASVAFLDLYSAFDEMFTYPDRYGIVDIENVCCASMNIPVAGLVNGFTTMDMCGPMSSVCDDPSTYLNWDGYHYTDNTVRQMVNMLVEGKFIMPSHALARFGAAQISKAPRPLRNVGLSHNSVIRI